MPNINQAILPKPPSPRRPTFTDLSASTTHRCLAPSRTRAPAEMQPQSTRLTSSRQRSVPRGVSLLFGAVSVVLADFTVLFLTGRTLMGFTQSCGLNGTGTDCSQDLGMILAVGVAALVPLAMLLRSGWTELGLLRQPSRAPIDNSSNERLISRDEYEMLLRLLSANILAQEAVSQRSGHPRRVSETSSLRMISPFQQSPMRRHHAALLLALLSALCGLIIGLNLFDALTGISG